LGERGVAVLSLFYLARFFRQHRRPLTVPRAVPAPLWVKREVHVEQSECPFLSVVAPEGDHKSKWYRRWERAWRVPELPAMLTVRHEALTLHVAPLAFLPRAQEKLKLARFDQRNLTTRRKR
jgi:hypothetical protein